MATIKQLNANRRNAQKSTGPRTPEGKNKSRFNAVKHGGRAESLLIPGEDPAAFEALRQELIQDWLPQDTMEKLMVEQIAVNEWKSRRLDRAAARVERDLEDTSDYVMSMNRLSLIQARLERSRDHAIDALKRYRVEHAERHKESGSGEAKRFRKGMTYGTCPEDRSYFILPEVCGLDGVWRTIPRELLGDFPKPAPTAGPAPQLPPKPNGSPGPGL